VRGAVWLGVAAAAGLQAQVSVTPTSLAFGTVAIGSTASRTFLVTQGDTQQPFLNYTVTIAGASEYSVSAADAAFTLTLRTSRTVTVTFAPAKTGAVTAIAVVSWSFQGQQLGSVPVELIGNGVAGYTVNVTSLSHGAVLLGCSASRTFRITPTSVLVFRVISDNAAFTVSPAIFTTGLPQVVTVTLAPAAPGPVSGVIAIAAATAEGIPVQTSAVAVSGSGSSISVTPATIDFGLVPVGVTSAPQTATFTEDPFAEMSLSFDSTSSNPAFRTSAVSSNRQAQITFTPPGAGQFRATLTYVISRTDQGFLPCQVTRTVIVSGTGAPLTVTAEPGTLDFGRVDIGASSRPQTTTLTNSASIAFNGTASTSDVAYGVTPAQFAIAPGGRQAFSITFRPAAVRSFPGALSLTLTSTVVPTTPVVVTVTVSLIGEGRAPAAISASPATADFGDVSVGSSAIRGVTVSNTGGAPASVSATSNSQVVSVAPSSFTLAGGTSQVVNLTYSPAAAGPLAATVSFAVEGVAQASVSVTGRAVMPTFSYLTSTGQGSGQISPGGVMTFGTINAGETSEGDFRITNTGTGPATLTAINTTGAAFRVTGLPALPSVLQAGSTLSWRVAFAPEGPGAATGALHVEGRVFNLSGTALVTGVTITGGAATVAPATQPAVGVQFARSYPVPVSGQLILSFSPNAVGGDDPAIQFPSGRAVSFTVPANSTTAQFAAGAATTAFQSGTVAGSIGLRVTLAVGATDVTPAPVAPSRTIAVPRGAPVVRSVTIANRTATTFQAVAVVFSTTREINTLLTTLAGTSSLQTTRITQDVGPLVTQWYSSGPAAAFGSLATITITYTVQGPLSDIRSISISLASGDGTSPAVEAAL